MALTDTFLRGLKTTGKNQRVFDGGGLYIYVTKNGSKLWRMRYRFDGKLRDLSLGRYDFISLKVARELRNEAKALLVRGIDPATHKKAVKETRIAKSTNSFEIIAREWHSKQKKSWTSSHSNKVLAALEKDIFPIIGSMPIEDITAPQLLEALRRIEARGALDTAHRVLQNCGAIFRYAIATGRSEKNIADNLKGALSPAKSEHFASIREPKAVGQLLRDIDIYHGNLIVKTALYIAPYVFVRPIELRMATWEEFNLDNA